MSGWLRAGLIVGIVLVIFRIINALLPAAVCITGPLELIAYIIAGAMAASYVPPIRNAGQGAGQGAIAGLLASLIAGVLGVIISTAAVATGAATRGVPIPTDQFPPGMQVPGIETGLTGIGGALIFGTVCCTIGLFIAAALGAIGGALYAAFKAD